MNRNISVFILLILLASSFKYRTKAREQVLPIRHIQNQSVTPVSLQSVSFQEAVAKLQQGNKEFAAGQPSTYKALWSRSGEVTNFCGVQGQEYKGWESVEKSLDSFNKRISGKNFFRIEKIANHAGAEQGYVLQKEHYVLPDGHKLDLHVTIVFRRENNEWKIVHRHSDELVLAAESIIAAK